MTPDELRALAQECFDAARESHDDDLDDLMEACERLDNAASILEGAP